MEFAERLPLLKFKNLPKNSIVGTSSYRREFQLKKIRKDLAITGEINMQGNVTAIGGLDLKILGGIKKTVIKR